MTTGYIIYDSVEGANVWRRLSHINRHMKVIAVYGGGSKYSKEAMILEVRSTDHPLKPLSELHETSS